MAQKKDKIWQWIREHSLWFEYSALALIILLPLLLPGYILTLDLVFTPTFAWPTEPTNLYPLEALLWLVHFILPGDVIEKIILFVILLLSGVGMHILLRSVSVKKAMDPEIWRIALYFGGIFYMINPFTYSRFMAGQWLFLLGYAMLPFFVLALIRFLALPGWKSMAKLVAWAFAIVSVSIHHIGILLLLVLLVMLSATIFKYWRSSKHVKRFFGLGGVGFLILSILSSFWLIPAFLGQGSIAGSTLSFDQGDFDAFQTVSTGALGAIGEVVRLQGFWAEARELYVLPQAMVPLWGLLFLLLWVLVIIGMVKAWKNHRMVVAIGGMTILAGIILAATPLIEWVSQAVPFASGYREPHKFASLVAFGYAFLGVFGVAYVLRWAADRFGEAVGQVAVVACLLLPLAITPSMLWGFGGQLSPRQYPAGWYEMNQTVRSLPGDEQILFLPWHQYDTYDFSGRIIANPAEKFFEAPVLISDDPELGNAGPNVPDEQKQAIGAALKEPEKLAERLKTLSVGYVMFANDAGVDDYSYLDRTPGISLVSENNDLKLYKVE